ncbi:MAG: LCP family protein [Anaerolineales bacterium]|nr:LCP family protein [Anaerolineales bacterium]
MSIPPRRPKVALPQNWPFYLLLGAFLLAAAITAYLVYDAVRTGVLALGNRLQGPEISVAAERSAPVEELPPLDLNTPLQPERGPAPNNWDGGSRVNVLLIGLDYRSWETGNGPPLADTLILLTMDPQSQTAGMLSIPRDLWVNLPDMGYHKINQAYQYGEANAVKGGGAGLTIQTVERLLETDIHFYAEVDFGAFVRMIDELGGVKLTVPETLTIDPLGEDNSITLQPGVQTLPGDLALAYARARNTAGSDFDRAQRQQQVILGVRDRVISFQMLPTLIAKAPVLYYELAQGVHTNLSLQQIINLAWMAQQIPQENIHQAVIGPDQVDFSTSAEGMAILLPIPEEIFTLRDQVFSSQPAIVAVETPESIPTPMVERTLQELVVAEDARIALYNGTFTAGLAARVDAYLQSQGLVVDIIGNADQAYEQTTVIDYTGNPYTISFLSEVLGIPPSKIYQRYDPNSELDVEVVLGADWVEVNPLP